MMYLSQQAAILMRLGITVDYQRAADKSIAALDQSMAIQDAYNRGYQAAVDLQAHKNKFRFLGKSFLDQG